MAEAPGEGFKRRSEPRAAVELRVGVVGVDLNNRVFNEQTRTLNVSRVGVCLRLDSELPLGTRVSVGARGERQRTHVATFEVRWTAKSAGRYLTGARLVSNGGWLTLLEETNSLPA